ncbi:MAG TPA: hypothetical protein VFU15_16610 [Bacteroidia bacterium]|nr:hypothetical protein [Bacteroidia bacterium]
MTPQKLVSLFALCCVCVMTKAQDTISLCKGKMAEVMVEKCVYENSATDFFYLHVILKNLTDDTIGVDLSHNEDVVHINQWTTGDTTFRMVIDEAELTYSDPDRMREQQLKNDFHAGKLTIIPPHSSVDYYHNFNGGPAKNLRRQEHEDKSKYVLFSLKGQLTFTDGKTLEDFHTGDYEHGKDNFPDVAIRCPVEWKKIPAGALIITD